MVRGIYWNLGRFGSNGVEHENTGRISRVCKSRERGGCID